MQIQDSFERFHQENPHVYKNLCDLARQWKNAGHTKIGIKMLFEVLRWNSSIDTVGEEFKLNNDYTSRYVRMIQENEPDLAMLFRTRILRA